MPPEDFDTTTISAATMTRKKSVATMRATIFQPRPESDEIDELSLPDEVFDVLASVLLPARPALGFGVSGGISPDWLLVEAGKVGLVLPGGAENGSTPGPFGMFGTLGRPRIPP